MNLQTDVKERVAIYIDGSNMYFSVKKTFNCKIDLEKFCKKLTNNEEVVKINYYIAPVEQFSNPTMYAQQQSFLKKIKKIDKLSITFGRLEKRKQEGKTYYVKKLDRKPRPLGRRLFLEHPKHECLYKPRLLSRGGTSCF